MEKQDIREIILETIVESLEAQAKAVRKLSGPGKRKEPVTRRMSQVEMTFDILKREGVPLHINEILLRISKIYKVALDRESLVSALSKKVARSDRFLRTGKNTFALRQEVR